MPHPPTRTSPIARRIALVAAIVLAMFASYELGMANDSLVVLVVPVVLTVVIVVALASVQAAPKRAMAPYEQPGGWERFGIELERSRRHGRPLSLLRATPPRMSGWEPDTDFDELVASVRAVDAAWIDGRHVLILMPETERAATATAIARLSARLPELREAELRLAVYPEDGITSGALVARLDDPAAAPRAADIIQLAGHEADRHRERLG